MKGFFSTSYLGRGTWRVGIGEGRIDLLWRRWKHDNMIHTHTLTIHSLMIQMKQSQTAFAHAYLNTYAWSLLPPLSYGSHLIALPQYHLLHSTRQTVFTKTLLPPMPFIFLRPFIKLINEIFFTTNSTICSSTGWSPLCRWCPFKTGWVNSFCGQFISFLGLFLQIVIYQILIKKKWNKIPHHYWLGL